MENNETLKRASFILKKHLLPLYRAGTNHTISKTR